MTTWKPEMVDLFKVEVSDRAAEIDPGEEEHWFSMTLGWALAKGMSVDVAHKFAIHICYHTDLG